jgi:Zn-dependent protease with chaperone function
VIPAAWSAPLGSYFWQVALHASVLGAILYIWVRRLGLPPGRTRRRLLVLLLVLPLVTAAVPGRSGLEFAERLAWLNSARLLAVPLVAGLRVHHAVLLLFVAMAALTFWQELLAFLRRPRPSGLAVPDSLARMARGLPGWSHCAVGVSGDPAMMVATSGWPGRPRLIVSRGALDALSGEELEIVIAHEHAHWQGGRWLVSHALFLARLLQCYHPVALWAFREYCVELESDCDAAATSGRDPRVLARVLLRIYQGTDRRDVAARAVLRRRVDLLMAGGPERTGLPPATMAAAAALMLMVLPWIV